MYELQELLGEISGFDAVSLQPAAGAQGEFTGVLVFRAYHLDRGDAERTEILVPDSAHGTNPATAAMVGYKVVEVKSDRRGNCRPRRSQEQALAAHRRPDADQPEHARPVRGEHSARSRGWSTRPAA